LGHSAVVILDSFEDTAFKAKISFASQVALFVYYNFVSAYLHRSKLYQLQKLVFVKCCKSNPKITIF